MNTISYAGGWFTIWYVRSVYIHIQTNVLCSRQDDARVRVLGVIHTRIARDATSVNRHTAGKKCQ